jgi:hypothetical protein
VASGLSIYRWAIVLSVIVQLISLAELAVDPSLGRLSSLSSSSGVNFSSGSGGLSGAALAFGAATGLFGLIGFVLAVIAFVRWRNGVEELRKSVVARGPFPTAPLAGPAAQAASGYRYAVWLIGIWILAVILGGIVIAGLFLSGLDLSQGLNGTASAPTNAQINHALSSLIGPAISLGAILLLMGLVFAYFVTSSLEGFLSLPGPRPTSLDFTGTRHLVFLSILLGIGGLLNIVYPGLGAIALIGPLLSYVACQRYLTAAEQRLGTPAL